MSIHCAHCGNENLDQARFCMHCSQPLVRTCAKCGGSAALTARFCPHCGAPVTQLTPPISLAFTGRLQPATVLIGRYQIVRKLGQGGMGAVYLTQDLRLAGKQWAVKEMSDAAIADANERQQAVQAFQQEAQMLATLDHRHLPKVTDYFSEQGNQYLVIEFVPGETLEKKLEQTNGPLLEAQALNYVAQLCDVLDYLHKRRPPIIFRDLKPSNIMLQPDDQIKLIDFGIARHFKPGKSKDTQAMGTPGYAAPEQYGQGQSDARSDIYALGATFHHMLTGLDPGVNPFHFERPRQLNPRISQPLDEVVVKAIELKPERRWQTVADLSQALQGKALPTLVSPVTDSRTAGGTSGYVQFATSAASPRPIPPPVSFSGLNYANYEQRVGAYIVDAILYVIGGSLCFAFLGGNSNPMLGLIAILLFMFLYFVRPTALSGQTVGKRLCKIKVVDGDGNPPGWQRALMRYYLGVVLVEAVFGVWLLGLVGYLWPLWDKDKQAWHDKIAGTYVVQL